MVYKPVGVDENSAFPTRVTTYLDNRYVNESNYTTDKNATNSAISGLTTGKASVDSLNAMQEQVDDLGGLIGSSFRYRSSNDVSLTTQTFADVAGFSWTAEANSIYEVRYKIRVHGTSDVGDIKFQFTGPIGASSVMAAFGGGANMTADRGGTFLTSDREGWEQSTGPFGIVPAAPQIVTLELEVITGSTGGVIQLQAARNTADTAPALIKARSGFDGEKVA